MKYAINEQIKFEMAIEMAAETRKRLRCEWFAFIRTLAANRNIRIDTKQSRVSMIHNLRMFKKCGRARP